jgi:hypothetical protein
LEPSSPPLMAPHGLQGPLGLQIILGESTTRIKSGTDLKRNLAVCSTKVLIYDLLLPIESNCQILHFFGKGIPK